MAGVGVATVWKRRKAFGLGRTTEGTSALLSQWAPETIQREKATANLGDAQGSPERAAKIAVAWRGKPMPDVSLAGTQTPIAAATFQNAAVANWPNVRYTS